MQVVYKHIWGGGLTRKLYIAYLVGGEGVGASVKGLRFYQPENGF